MASYYLTGILSTNCDFVKNAPYNSTASEWELIVKAANARVLRRSDRLIIIRCK